MIESHISPFYTFSHLPPVVPPHDLDDLHPYLRSPLSCLMLWKGSDSELIHNAGSQCDQAEPEAGVDQADQADQADQVDQVDQLHNKQKRDQSLLGWQWLGKIVAGYML